MQLNHSSGFHWITVEWYQKLDFFNSRTWWRVWKSDMQTLIFNLASELHYVMLIAGGQNESMKKFIESQAYKEAAADRGLGFLFNRFSFRLSSFYKNEFISSLFCTNTIRYRNSIHMSILLPISCVQPFSEINFFPNRGEQQEEDIWANFEMFGVVLLYLFLDEKHFFLWWT